MMICVVLITVNVNKIAAFTTGSLKRQSLTRNFVTSMRLKKQVMVLVVSACRVHLAGCNKN